MNELPGVGVIVLIADEMASLEDCALKPRQAS